MRIAYVTDERYPSPHTDCQQVIKTADALAGEGHDVDLIVPRMARHLRLSTEDVKQEIGHYYNVDGRFRLQPLLSFPGSDLRIEKIPHGLIAPLLALVRGYDMVYTRNVLPLQICARLGPPVLFETYRPLPKSNPQVWRAVANASRLPRFLGVSTHSEYARRVIVDAGVDPDAVASVPNGYDARDFASRLSKETARKALGLPGDKRLAVYTGHLRMDKGMSSVLDLAEDLPETLFLLVGGAPEDIAVLDKQAASRRLRNLRLYGRRPIAEVPPFLYAADVLFLPPTAGPMQSSALPSVLPIKTFSYLAAGRAIVAPDLPDTAGLLLHDINALRIPADDRQAARVAFHALEESPALAARLGQGALATAANYTWDARARRLVSFIERRLQALS